ncbi:MAG: hypothetical protein RBQ97_11595 [Acholeplasma sp.]|nr:hypothetical protein [Acholeplasma sp.]
MCIFRSKKTNQDYILKSKETLGKNASDLAIICSKINDFPDLFHKCNMIHDELKYFSPSSDEDIQKIDQTIHQRIDDIKIEVNRAIKEKGTDGLTVLFNTLNSLIVQRNEESKRFKRK